MENEQQWDRLLEEQTLLFRKTIKKNAQLEERVIALERELNVWKLAFTANDVETTVLKKQIRLLERNIGALKDDNPLVLCLIDGDGNIFAPQLVSLGRQGGGHAAQLLTKGITDHFTEDTQTDAPLSISHRTQIWVSFEGFVMGFNEASPLFSIIDVGSGKDAADTKVKEYLRVFTRFPQTCKIFFGGGHDNGYATTLNALNNEGLLHKIILLKGYHEIAFELKILNLPFVEFKGVFMTQKLPVKHSGRMPSAEHDKSGPRSVPNTNNVQASPSKSKIRRPSDTAPPSTRPSCKAGETCRYGHNYDLGLEELNAMRATAKKSPCGYANKNKVCPFDAEKCPLGHVCPGGRHCKFFKAGKCKFYGRGMHDADASQRSSIAVMSEVGSVGESVATTPPATPPSIALQFGSEEWYRHSAEMHSKVGHAVINSEEE
ncbi:hypothetical protein BU17DRAFT_93042 [Hysterangium stoloniferum]|nr:hypothetical protein BU17DRAFT_93042 [Hysterangium stoloniferum]